MEESPMSRVQLALNVADLESSVDFYSKLFGTAPHKRRPGYANFEVLDPPLKLVLIEMDPQQRGSGTSQALNHLGIEVADTAAVSAAQRRLDDQGLEAVADMGTDCCFALQDKVWVHDPAGAPWEVYTVIDDNPTTGSSPVGSGCCTPASAELLTISTHGERTSSCC
jgi:catechol 2,3-dioxygenase-like lactoylglutathione lyase family enzyme